MKPMNPDWLLKHFDQISEAPDAVARLRRFILDLAVRGKLVEQDPNDEPALELLKRVSAEKHRLAEEGQIRKQKPLPPIREHEVPFNVPKNWKLVRLGDVSTLITKGSTPTSYGHSFVQHGINFVKVEAIKAGLLLPENITSHINPETHEFLKRSQLKSGDFLFSIAGSIGTCAVVTDQILPANTNQALAIIRGANLAFSLGYLSYSSSSDLLALTVAKARGGAMNNISLEDVSNFILPLPPLAEQHRIVAKVDELMALCDELEAAQAKRERRRDRLVAATLHGLNNGEDSSEPGARPTFEESARFYFNHLPRLTTRPEHIQQLRQTILNLAVRGKLVQQRKEEGSGWELLCRLKAVHPENRKFGATRRKGQSPLDQLNCPGVFPIPSTWRWAYLDFLCEQLADIDHNMPQTVADGVPFISAKDLKDDGTIDFSNPKMISEDDYKRLSRKVQMRSGDIVYSRIGARLGKARIVNVDTRFLISYSCCLVRPMHEFVDKHYLQRFLDSNLALNQAYKGAQSIGVPDLGLGEIKEFRIPLPPLPEQHRIVAKVDELMALCDKLEIHLTEGATTRRQLLEATLCEAIAS